jgi:tetratricopeptide (TPR) repeat protein/predicted MPP superfamily phosphohydrolase
MGDTINWLHFTDLHFGQSEQEWIWPKARTDLFRRLESVGKKLGGWDLVFFTGDFVQSGKPEEYRLLNQELEQLWEVLRRSGREPLLCAVPGNHDLQRPDPSVAVNRTVIRDWWGKGGVRSEFWSRRDGQYEEAVDGAFASFVNWLSSVPVPVIPHKPGRLPGDFSATYKKNDVSLGIVGLNTTFLQIAKGNYLEQLDVHVSQMNDACDGDPDRWTAKHTMSVLLTHQPASWLHKEAQDHFRQLVSPPGRFFSQFCGHLHESQSTDVVESGATPRRLRLGASLFGLAEWGEDTKQKRIHGYTYGQFVLENESYEQYWPLKLFKTDSGGWQLLPNPAFYLNDDHAVVTPINVSLPPPPELPGHPIIPRDATPRPTILLKRRATTPVAPPDPKLILESSPKFTATAESHHRRIRGDERARLVTSVRESQAAWLVADWGIGKDEFLATCFETLKADTPSFNAFVLKCEEVAELDHLENVFAQQFGASLSEFCDALKTVEGCCLIFDELNPRLVTGAKIVRFREIVSAIQDFNPKISIIVTSRGRPSGATIPTIELMALDEPDTRIYLTHHAEAPLLSADGDTVEKIHYHSGGLPMHLDRIVRELRVASLESVLDASAEKLPRDAVDLESIPKALQQAVTSLASSADDLDRRSFKLLKVLCVLPFGETIETLKHFLPREPFFNSHVLQLHALSLIETKSLYQISATVGRAGYSSADMTAPKVLKVPRQVRDYVVTLMDEEEREELVLAGIDRLFGRRWRDGHVTFRVLPPQHLAFIASGAGNEYALIQQIALFGNISGKAVRATQASSLALSYARKLRSSDRYRDLARVAGDLLKVIDREKEPQEYAELAALYGEGLRMVARHEEALERLEEALQVGDSAISEFAKADIYLDIALAEESLGRKDRAIAAARTSKQLSGKNTSRALHAESIITSLTLEGEERLERLIRMERIARRHKHFSVANNIALDIVRASTDTAERVRRLDDVLKSEDEDYTKARAIVQKARVLLERGDDARLNNDDLAILARAYSYLHAQRMSGLFDACHELLWQAFEREGQIGKLLQLFRHTSFIWRIRGEEAKEATYLQKFDQNLVAHVESSSVALIFEVQYYRRRVKSVVATVLT